VLRKAVYDLPAGERNAVGTAARLYVSTCAMWLDSLAAAAAAAPAATAAAELDKRECRPKPIIRF